MAGNPCPKRSERRQHHQFRHDLGGGTNGIAVNNVVQLGTASTAGGIGNSGTIFARLTGIFVSVSNFAGGVTNSGTISAGTAANRDGIFIIVSSAFTGGIKNSGVISAGGGIAVNAGSFTGGFTNSGTITTSMGAIGDGVNLFANDYTGGFSNSGTISGFVGAEVTGGSFAGDISNSGAITAIHTGLAVGFTTFAGTISNSGTISSNDAGIVNLGPSPISIFNSGAIIAGERFPSIDLRQASPGNILTPGPYSITGVVAGQGTDTFQLGGVGAGAFDLDHRLAPAISGLHHFQRGERHLDGEQHVRTGQSVDGRGASLALPRLPVMTSVLRRYRNHDLRQYQRHNADHADRQ